MFFILIFFFTYLFLLVFFLSLEYSGERFRPFMVGFLLIYFTLLEKNRICSSVMSLAFLFSVFFIIVLCFNKSLFKFKLLLSLDKMFMYNLTFI